MNDSDFIQEIACKRVELGGDSEGVVYNWKRLQEAVIDIEYAQQSVQPTVATCSACGRELLPDGSCPNDDPSTRNSG